MMMMNLPFVVPRLDDLGVITADNLNLRYDFEGNVEWEPPVLFNVHCQVSFEWCTVEC